MAPKVHRICSYIQIFEFAGLFITIGEQDGYSKHANSFGSCQQITHSKMAQPNDAVDSYRDGLNAKDAQLRVQAFSSKCRSGLLLRLIRLDYQYVYLWYHLLYLVCMT